MFADRNQWPMLFKSTFYRNTQHDVLDGPEMRSNACEETMMKHGVAIISIIAQAAIAKQHASCRSKDRSCQVAAAGPSCHLSAQETSGIPL